MKQVKVGFRTADIQRMRAKAATERLSLSSFIAARALGRKAKEVAQINLPVMIKLADVGNHLNTAAKLLRDGASHSEVEAAIGQAAESLAAAALGGSAE